MGRKIKKVMIIALSMGWMLFGMPMETQAAGSTQQEIDKAEENKDQLEEMIEAHEKELEGLKGEQNDLQKRLSKLNEELMAISANLVQLEQQIVDKEAEIVVTQENLQAAKEQEAWQYDCMEQHIKLSYESGRMGWFSVLFGADCFADILNFATYFDDVASYSDRMLEEIIAGREFIESEEARLEEEKQELDILKINAQAEKSRVNELIEEARNSIADYEDQIEAAEKAAREYEAEMKKLEQNLDYLKKKLAAEIALAQAAANAKWRDISDITFAEDDLYLLANLIYCEAGGEPYQGQVAVGAVVINRVRSEKFPDTVTGVIYQKRQFSPAGSGRLALALAQNKATQSCYKAAQEAMAGVTNVGDCLFFRTPIEGLTGISIGGHIFY